MWVWLFFVLIGQWDSSFCKKKFKNLKEKWVFFPFWAKYGPID